MPIVVHELERHPLGTQAFVPMNGEAFVVIVALGDDKPDLLRRGDLFKITVIRCDLVELVVIQRDRRNVYSR